MHFTVHFRGDDTWEEDYSYGLVFNPNPRWVKGAAVVLSMESKTGYRQGSVKALLKAEKLTRKLTKPRSATILVHEVGLGTPRDYQNLISDLEASGFETRIFE
ncbi:MAG TPA: hypothetical protein VI078_13055 [bacterium]